MYRPSTPKGHQCELSGIKAALHRNQAQSIDHSGIGNLDDTMRRRYDFQAQGDGAFLLYGTPGRIQVQRHLPAQKIVRTESSQ